MSEDAESLKKEVDVAGIRSDVTRRAFPMNETVGHVLFLDCEDTNYKALKSWCEANLEVYFIFKSSEDNYHVINPVVRSAVEINEIKKACPYDDSNHRTIGYDKRAWVLRVTEKGDKPAPELVDSRFGVSEFGFDRPISEPHVNYIIEEFGTYDYLKTVEKYDMVVGYSLKMVKYGTYEKHEGERVESV